MIFLGDIHGRYDKIPDTRERIVQVGDLGLGFNIEAPFSKFIPKDNFYFIRGNHDKPETCRKTKGYLGEYGYNDELGIYYISGAYSIDHVYRLAGINWWDDEELSFDDFDNIFDQIIYFKPRIIVSHDCPYFITKYKSKTSMGLAHIFVRHKPEYWIFGHHHKIIRKKVLGTKFVGLGINEIWWEGKD